MSTKKKNLRFRPIAILLMASVIALSATTVFGHDVDDISHSCDMGRDATTKIV